MIRKLFLEWRFPKQYIWDGIVKTEPLEIYEEVIEQRIDLFNKAKSGQWKDVLALLPFDEILDSYNIINPHITEPDEYSLNTLLHYTAVTNAPVNVVTQLVERGASRTRRNAQGQRPVDIALEQGYKHLIPSLQPKLKRVIPTETIRQIEYHFHIMTGQLPNDPYQLPQIEVLLEGHYSGGYFPIIGGYGGYSYWFGNRFRRVALLTRFESRIVAGSAIIRRITSQGVDVVAAGYSV